MECKYRGNKVGSFEGKDIFECGHKNVVATYCSLDKIEKNQRLINIGDKVQRIKYPVSHCDGCRLRKVSNQINESTASRKFEKKLVEEKHSFPIETLISNMRIANKPKYKEITIRNAIYHCCPLLANDGWKKATTQWLKRINLFNGRRVMAISTGEGCATINEVKDFMNFADLEIIAIPNDKNLREVATFFPLLQAVENTNNNEATFYSHSKGNSTADSQVGANRWRNAMFTKLLDTWSDVSEVLKYFPTAGTTMFKFNHFKFPSGLIGNGWMYAGTFWWYRHDCLYTRDWKQIPMDRYAAENYLSTLFQFNQAFSLYQPWDVRYFPPGSPYDPRYYGEEYDDT